jgi:hypothetical protein
MKTLLLASTVLFSAALYAQNDLSVSAENENVKTYTLSGPVFIDRPDVFLGELDVKSKKSRPVGKDAYYFENSIPGKLFFLESFFFKVNQAKYRTKLQVHLYKKKDFLQEVYTDDGTVTYPSYIPGDEIKTEDIIIYIDPGQKGLVEVDLLQFEIVIPVDGVFVSLELISYLDESGAIIKRSKFKEKEFTTIDFHPTTNDNYCGLAMTQGSEKTFWINNNKSIKTDFKYAFKKEPSKSILVAPNFGLKVGHK